MAQQQQIFLYLLHTDFFPQGAVQGDIEKRFLPHILDYLLVKGVKTQPPPIYVALSYSSFSSFFVRQIKLVEVSVLISCNRSAQYIAQIFK